MSRILLVEDVEDNRELARLLLEAAGHAVVEAHNGLEALSIARSCRPDLILMDLSLPVMDGWDATRRLKAEWGASCPPVVALTAHAMAGDEARVLGAGFDGYIVKPIDVNVFANQAAGYLA